MTARGARSTIHRAPGGFFIRLEYIALLFKNRIVLSGSFREQ